MHGSELRQTIDLHNAVARSTDPQTSHDAAAVATRKLQKLERLIITQINKYEWTGLTTKELSEFTGVARDSLSPRMKRLVADGKIRRSDERRDRAAVYYRP